MDLKPESNGLAGAGIALIRIWLCNPWGLFFCAKVSHRSFRIKVQANG